MIGDEKTREQNRKSVRKYTEANHEAVLARKRAHYAENRERIQARCRAYSREWRKVNPEKKAAAAKKYLEENRDKVRAQRRKSRYGIVLSEAAWKALFIAQKQRCAACSTLDPGKKGWATDHDHSTGIVRGILCSRCNLILGQLGDSAEGVRKYAKAFLDYLLRHEVSRL